MIKSQKASQRNSHGKKYMLVSASTGGKKDRKKETKKDTPTINCEIKKERKKEVFSKDE